MTEVFADTSYFLALLVPDDSNHDRALERSKALRCPLVTTDFIVLEVGNALSAEPVRHLFATWLSAMRQDRRMRVVQASRTLLDEAVSLFEAREDKDWSLTDCSSFVVMQDRGIVEALTADHHFEQAGFVALLR